MSSGGHYKGYYHVTQVYSHMSDKWCMINDITRLLNGVIFNLPLMKIHHILREVVFSERIQGIFLYLPGPTAGADGRIS